MKTKKKLNKENIFMDKSLNQNEENFTILPLAINVAGGRMGVVFCILLFLIRSIMLNLA